jgi:hypothetical protein
MVWLEEQDNLDPTHLYVGMPQKYFPLLSNLDPIDWGWKRENQSYVASLTDKEAAPDYLLKMTHENCTTGCKTPRCSCNKCGPKSRQWVASARLRVVKTQIQQGTYNMSLRILILSNFIDAEIFTFILMLIIKVMFHINCCLSIGLEKGV